jgi:hypothetical protein
MSNARNLARLLPNTSGLLPDANLAGLSASKISGALAKANMSTGSVIQVVEYTYNGGMSASGTSAALTLISGNITPNFSTSKILVMFQATASTTSGQMFGAWINRNGSQVGHNTTSTSSYQTISNASMGSGYSGGDPAQTTSGWVLDTPATTSSTNYQLVVGTRTDGSQGIRANWSFNYSSPQHFSLPAMCKIILMEVAA